jgi:hypothetical protein
VSSEDREALADVLHNVDGIECSPRDEQIPCCLRDADAIDAAGWVSPDTHRRAVDEAREQGAGDTDRLIRDAVRRAEAERDDWKRRHARVQEMYRERFAGLSDADWHAQHCGAMATVERVRALAGEWASALGEPTAQAYAADLRAALDGAAEQDIHDLIERSSLGTPGAKALRESVSDEEVARVIKRATEIAAERDGGE